MRIVLTILKYVVLYVILRWVFDRILPFQWIQATRIVAQPDALTHPFGSTKAFQGWLSVITYTVLPVFMLALCAWDITTRAARTAR